MNLFPEEHETIAGVSAALRARETTCVEVLERCHSNIERWEPSVHAWVHLDLDGAMAEARRQDEAIAEGQSWKPLHGIPIGIKDIIDVHGMPTGCGSKLWKDRIAASDAWVVHQLRNAGAIILGKTVTTAYAWIDPPVTRNPWNLERTPGGSSSGSAAAVATGMCLGAIGTQTGGSIIRPAAFCGVAGFKPGLHRIPLLGVLPLAQSLDHAGPIARSVEDLNLLGSVLSDAIARSDEDLDLLSDVPFGAEGTQPQGPPRIGLLDGDGFTSETFWSRAQAGMRHAFNMALRALCVAGAEITPPCDTIDFARIVRTHRTILACEAAAVHCVRVDEYPDDYPPRIRSLIDEGVLIPAFEYVWAKRLQPGGGGGSDIEGKRSWYDEHSALFYLIHDVDFLATPATLGPAPDLMTTGDSSFQAPWSFFGFPVVTFPIGLDSDELPLGIQLIGSLGSDDKLLACAAWCERVVRDAYKSGTLTS